MYHKTDILNSFLRRDKIELTTDDGWGCVGTINSITQEDGSGNSWILSVFAHKAVYPCTVQVYIRFSRDTNMSQKVKII